MNNIVNDKKGHNIVNDSFAHKPDGLIVEVVWRLLNLPSYTPCHILCTLSKPICLFGGDILVTDIYRRFYLV